MPKRITSHTLEFVQNHVLNVTDLVRTKKLSQILDSYADTVSTDIYVIQNDKKRNARGVIVDFEYFQDLLRYREAVELAIDEQVERLALERRNEQASVSLEELLRNEDISIDDIRKEMLGLDVESEE